MNASTYEGEVYTDTEYVAVPTTRLVWPDAAPLMRVEEFRFSVRAQWTPIEIPESVRFLVACILTGIAMWLCARDMDNQVLGIFLAFLVGGVIWWLFPRGEAR